MLAKALAAGYVQEILDHPHQRRLNKVMELIFVDSSKTFFAPAARAPRDVLEWQAALFREGLIGQLLDSVSEMVAILNAQRQVVFANRPLLKLLACEDCGTILGLRPGEIFECEGSQLAPNGCGTGEQCRRCGAVLAILAGLRGEQTEEECRIIRRSGEDIQAFELKVCATPLREDKDVYVIFSIQDISHERRRRVLERIFFHDILNTAGGLRDLALFIKEETSNDVRETAELLHSYLYVMVDEIVAQKELLDAENEELATTPTCVMVRNLLESVRDMYSRKEIAQGRLLRIENSDQEDECLADYTLLRRVVGNMVKNALEAVQPGQTVTVGCTSLDDGIQLWVHNPGFIHPDVQGQIFKRSFSTKAPDRGLGTYSIRLLTERYLRGKVSFTTSPIEGTTFFLRLPRPKPGRMS